MKAMHSVEQWLKQQTKKKEPKLIIMMIGNKKQQLLNQLYEGTGND